MLYIMHFRVKGCGAKFTTNYNRRKHTRQVHRRGEGGRSTFQCSHHDCVIAGTPEVAFGTADELREHERTAHEADLVRRQ